MSARQSFVSKPQTNNYMKDTIDLLTQMAEDDHKMSKTPAKNQKFQKTPKKQGKQHENKENNSKIQVKNSTAPRKLSVYSSNNNAMVVLQNAIDCNDSGEEMTMDSNAYLMTGDTKNSHHSSNFQTPEKRKTSRSSSKKKMKNSESFKKTNTIVSGNRLYEQDKKIKEKKEELRKKYLEEEKQTMRTNPKINPKSKQLLNNDNQKPLFLRVSEVQKRKNEGIEKTKHVLESQRKEKEPEPTFVPDLSTTKKKEDKTRSVPEFLNDLEEWRKKKKENTEKFHISLLTEEMKEYTFHPQLNKHSLKMASQKKENGENNEETTHKIRKIDSEMTFHPQMDEKSKKIIQRKTHRKRNSFMDPTLQHLSRVNETKFQNVVRRMSLDPSALKILSTTYMSSKKEYYEGRSKGKMQRGKSVCFIDALKKSERKIKEMEDMFDKQLFIQRSMNRVEYDRSLRFLVEIALKKKYQY